MNSTNSLKNTPQISLSDNERKRLVKAVIESRPIEKRFFTQEPQFDVEGEKKPPANPNLIKHPEQMSDQELIHAFQAIETRFRETMDTVLSSPFPENL